MRLTMQGRLSECVLLSYSTPSQMVATLVPPGLELRTHKGRAFWNVVVSTVDKMRPLGMPRWVGVTYHHVAYRLQVTAVTAAGEQLSGLYFLRSDVNSSLIALTGNPLTDFRFHRSRIDISKQHEQLAVAIESTEQTGCAELRVSRTPCSGLETGLFRDDEEREQILKYQPLGLAMDNRHRIRLAEVFRDESAWQEQHVEIIDAKWGFLDAHNQGPVHLERATRVAPLNYQWRLGRTAIPGKAITPS